MTTWGAGLHEDNTSIKTSSSYGDRGDGVSDWYSQVKAPALGVPADVATTSPTADSSLISLLKGLFAALGLASTNISTTALASSLIIKATPGRLRGISGYSTSTQFIQLHDSATLPANGAVPKVIIPIELNKPFSIDFGAIGRSFTLGIVVCNSSTGPTKTIGGADTWIDAQYI